MADNSFILSVSQLSFYLKSLIDGDVKTNEIFVSGEVSNLKYQYSSGHIYFSLKDDRSSIPVVVFKTYADNIKFQLKDGDRVICKASVSIYEKDTKIQLYVKHIQPYGLGSLYLAFEQLKSKLQKKGYFDLERKKSIPSFLKKIAVLTSETGSVIHDITSVVSRRFPICKIFLVNIPVQGEGAENIIADKLIRCDNTNEFDAIIIARGGGSFEDLSPFNSEILANAVFDCNTPVISAIGHETDFTICDFVSDLRAPTPSAAAEMLFKDMDDISYFLKTAKEKILDLTLSVINEKKHTLNNIKKSRCLSDPICVFDSKKEYYLKLNERLLTSYLNFIENYKRKLTVNMTRLNDLSPLSVLLRGYSIADKNRKIVRSIEEINKQDRINLKFYDGTASCLVLNTEINSNE